MSDARPSRVANALRWFWDDGIYPVMAVLRLATAFWIIFTSSGAVSFGVTLLLLWSIQKTEWRQ